MRPPTRYRKIREAHVAISDNGEDDPLTYHDVMEDSEKEKWLEAMNFDMESMYSNSV